MAGMRNRHTLNQLFQKIAKTAALLLVFSMAACDQAEPTRPIRISANSWVGYEPFFIAEAEGFFAPGSVHLIETPFSLTLEQALRGGTIDASSLSMSRAFTLMSEGFDITIVLVLDWSNGADMLLAKPDIGSVSELKGKRIGSEPRTVNTYLLLRALQEFGLSRDDVTIVPVITEQLFDAYQRDDIDAASVFGPEAIRLEEAGAKRLFDSSQIPGEILDVLVVRTSYLQENPERVQDLIAGWLKAVSYLESLEEGETPQTGLLSRKEFEAAVQDIRFAGVEDNRSFLEANATRLNAVLNARKNFSNSMSGTLNMEKAPQVDPKPFFEVLEEGGY